MVSKVNGFRRRADDDELTELIPFLRDRNPQVRHVALSNLVSHTPKESPCRNIFLAGLQSGAENDVIRDLKLLTRDQLVRGPFYFLGFRRC